MDSLQKVISDYCEDPSFDTGLLLLDLPTGYGKTTAVFKKFGREFPAIQ